MQEQWMRRCIDLARQGIGKVSTNPMVGAVVVHQDCIIGEGYHQAYGQPHAEVNAVAVVKDQTLLKVSTLYVNLEPCNHYGKTPPCTDLIIQHGIPRVVIGTVDTFSKVAGKGIQRLQEHGVEVITGVLEKESRGLNRRFFTYHEQQRPYVLLKWAQSTDGYIAPPANDPDYADKRHITGFLAQRLVHKWRTEEDAIMVGARTAVLDNPKLNDRFGFGKSPVRVLIDRNLTTPAHIHLLSDGSPTLVFTAKNEWPSYPGVTYIPVDFNQNLARQVLSTLYQKQVQSVMIEGGLHTLLHFIQSGLWDEARIFTAPLMLGSGTSAPAVTGTLKEMVDIGEVKLQVLYR